MKNRSILFLLFILAFSIRLFFLFLTDDGPGDPASRILDAQAWLKQPHIITSGYWLPLHTYLIGWTLCIWNNPNLSPRFLSLIFGSITILPFYLLIELLFDKKNAIVSTILLSVFNFHILYSTQTYSDVLFIFFLITSIYFFFKFKKEENLSLGHLVLSSIFLIFACMLRIEGWLFVPLIPLYLIKGKGGEPALIFFIISIIFPASWLLENYIKMHDPLPLATINVYEPTMANWSFFKRVMIYPYLIMRQPSPLVEIISILGLIFSLKKKKFTLSLFIFPIFLFLISTVNFGTNAVPKARYALTINILLLPYFMIGLEEIIKNLNSKIKTYFIAIIGISIIATYSYFYVFWQDILIPRFPLDAKNVSIWLKHNLKEQERVFIDNVSGWNGNITVSAGLDLDRAGLLAGLPFPGVATSWRYYLLKNNGFIEYFKQAKPKYFIYATNGFLTKYFSYRWKEYMEMELGVRLEFIQQKGNYIIYKIAYKD